MPRMAKEMSALEVKRLRHPGGNRNFNYSVGGVSGLLLQTTPTGARTWLLRVSIGGKRREIGLGGFPEVSLANAREAARETKKHIKDGIDPVEQKQKAREAIKMATHRNINFEDCTSEFLKSKLSEFKNDKHKAQWQNTLKTYAFPHIGKMQISKITAQDILRTLTQPVDGGTQLWTSKAVTADRVRQRIDSVMKFSIARQYRDGPSPARWEENLKEMLPKLKQSSSVAKQPAVQLKDAYRWFSALQASIGVSYRALELIALTATRSGEVRYAEWAEFDLNSDIWTIPAKRMKMQREHRVPLSPSASRLIKSISVTDSPFVFPGKGGNPLSDMTISKAMKLLNTRALDSGNPGFIDRETHRTAVPHGLRSTFRDWAGEMTNFSGDMAEIALAHKVANSVEAAYRRGDMMEKRREMMQAWSDFLETPYSQENSSTEQ